MYWGAMPTTQREHVNNYDEHVTRQCFTAQPHYKRLLPRSSRRPSLVAHPKWPASAKAYRIPARLRTNAPKQYNTTRICSTTSAPKS
jgi:hypothetical protein